MKNVSLKIEFKEIVAQDHKGMLLISPQILWSPLIWSVHCLSVYWNSQLYGKFTESWVPEKKSQSRYLILEALKITKIPNIPIYVVFPFLLFSHEIPFPTVLILILKILALKIPTMDF
jgi:hypothetical protein